MAVTWTEIARRDDKIRHSSDQNCGPQRVNCGPQRVGLIHTPGRWKMHRVLPIRV
jgi:hypothetical protein